MLQLNSYLQCYRRENQMQISMNSLSFNNFQVKDVNIFFHLFCFSLVEQLKQYSFILEISSCCLKPCTHDISLYILLHQKAHIENYFSKDLCNKNKLYSLYQCKQGLSGNSMNRRNNSMGNLYTAPNRFQCKDISAHVIKRGKIVKDHIKGMQ